MNRITHSLLESHLMTHTYLYIFFMTHTSSVLWAIRESCVLVPLMGTMKRWQHCQCTWCYIIWTKFWWHAVTQYTGCFTSLEVLHKIWTLPMVYCWQSYWDTQNIILMHLVWLFKYRGALQHFLNTVRKCLQSADSATMDMWKTNCMQQGAHSITYMIAHSLLRLLWHPSQLMTS